MIFNLPHHNIFQGNFLDWVFHPQFYSFHLQSIGQSSDRADMMFIPRIEELLDPENAGQHTEKFSPVEQLTQRNRSSLETDDYVVGPKADGERAFLVFEAATSTFYLIRHLLPPTKIEGSYIGPPILGGFILDTEVVVTFSGDQLILAFDVYPTIEDNLIYRNTVFKERRDTLTKILNSVVMPNLQLKPIAPSHKALSMWEIWRHCHYYKGLVFNRLGGKLCEPAIKWKPPDKLTIDVALGKPIESNSFGSCFAAHLYGKYTIDDDSNDDVVFVDSVLQKLDHKPFPTLIHLPWSEKSINQNKRQDKQKSNKARNNLPTENRVVTMQTIDFVQDVIQRFDAESFGGRLYWTNTDDIEQTHFDDIQKIKVDRLRERLHWIKGQVLCNGGNSCPCNSYGSSVIHCHKCGALIVKSGSGRSPSCQIQCSTVERSVVWVPSKYAEWSEHAVVEVDLLMADRNCNKVKFEFKRIRYDKKRANSLPVAVDILEQFVEPIELHDINFKILPRNTFSGSWSYRLPKSTCESNFTKLRKLHYQIKGCLYETFGGASIIDTCSGALSDLQIWKATKITSVVAIEKDESLYQAGLNHLRREEKMEGQLPMISFQQGDLSNPLDLSNICMPSHQVDSIFCNFALHYFWESEEKTFTFLDNLLPYLREGGRVVVTLLDGDKLHRRGSFSIISAGDLIEFDVNMVDEKTISVYIASIGRRHNESIILRSELQHRFKQKGLEFISWLPFRLLRSLSNHALSDEEIEMSNLYTAAVFEKCIAQSSVSCPEKLEAQEALLSDRLSHDLEGEIMSYFSIPDLVKCRLLSNQWRREIDKQEVKKKVKDSYFLGRELFNITQFYLPLRSFASFIQMGGCSYDSHHGYRFNTYHNFNEYIDFDPLDYGFDDYSDADDFDDFDDFYQR